VTSIAHKPARIVCRLVKAVLRTAKQSAAALVQQLDDVLVRARWRAAMPCRVALCATSGLGRRPMQARM
jgi:hypothetical protein